MTEDELVAVEKTEETEIDAVQNAVAASTTVNSQPGTSNLQPDIVQNLPAKVLRGGMRIFCQGQPASVQGKLVPMKARGTISFLGRTKQAYGQEGLFVLVSNHHVLRGFTQDLTHDEDPVSQPDSGFCVSAVAYSRVNGVLSPEVDGGVAELEPEISWIAGVKISASEVVLIEDTYTVTDAELRSGGPYPVWTWGATTNRKKEGILISVTANILNPALTPKGEVIRNPPLKGMIIASTDGTSFAEEGDSGAPIMNNDNQILGILWGDLGGALSGACLIDDVISQLHVEPFTKKNMPTYHLNPRDIHTTPVKECCPTKTNVKGPALPKVPPAPSQTPSQPTSLSHATNQMQSTTNFAESFNQKVLKTSFGRDLVNNIALHRQELERVREIPRVLAAWRRYGGALALAQIRNEISDDQILIPSTHRGQSTANCALSLLRVLQRYCSSELITIVQHYVQEIERFAGKTASELLAMLRQKY